MKTPLRFLLRPLVATSLAASLLGGLAGCPDECPAGTAGCPCKEGDGCDDGLRCAKDKCEKKPAATCPEGAEGCACYPNGTCDALDGVPMVCEGEVCTPPACPAGTLGCPCDAGRCEGDLVCEAGACARPTLTEGIKVQSAAVRACDLLLDLGALPARSVAFDGAVVGRFRLEGSRLAIAFTARDDQALTTPVAQVKDANDRAVDLSGVTTTTLSCFDRAGQKIEDPQLVLH